MKESLSPRELGQLVSISQSTIKRWIDDGRIHVVRTAGGHRRIPIEEAVQFIREQGVEAEGLEAMGIAPEAAVCSAAGDAAEMERMLYDALIKGEARTARDLIVGRYISGRPMTEIFDGPLRNVLYRMGELWKHDRQGIAVEHRAVDICIQAINQIRQSLPAPAVHAPMAIGGAPEGDPYLIPAMLVATVLTNVGFRVNNLGPNAPMDLFLELASETDASIVYLSMSGRDISQDTADETALLAERLKRETSAKLVVGGQRLNQLKIPSHPNLIACDTTAELAAFAKGLAAGKP